MGKILAHRGIPKVYSFHRTLSYSRNPFCRFTTSQDLQMFFDCHRRAFAHFGGNLYSVPAHRIRPRQLVETRATKSQFMLHSTMADSSSETLLATHPRAIGRGVRVVEEAHWGGLFTGTGRRTTTGDALPPPCRARSRGEESGPLRALLNRAAAPISRSGAAGQAELGGRVAERVETSSLKTFPSSSGG
ncbi:hypothetical protein [Streptomyces roseus]